MSPTRLYHVPQTRSSRILWELEEIGAPYELTTLTREERREPPHRARHPLGRVPVIEDDGAFLFESAAIALALADRHPESGLNFPLGTRERELVYQWALFAMTEIERLTIEARDAGERDPERAAEAAALLAERVAVVEDALRGREFIVGDRFTVADLLLGSALAFAARTGVVADGGEVRRYLDAQAARPARQVAYPPS
jgi:glutathione S-transferase